jgi:hypothetical protein
MLLRKVKIVKIPKKLQFVLAILALLIIIVLIVIIGNAIYQKVSNFVGTPQISENCKDTDGGKIPEIFGTCLDATRQTHSDTCVLLGFREPFKLQEWFCQNNTCVSEIIDCKAGFVCAAGQCTQS